MLTALCLLVACGSPVEPRAEPPRKGCALVFTIPIPGGGEAVLTVRYAADHPVCTGGE